MSGENISKMSLCLLLKRLISICAYEYNGNIYLWQLPLLKLYLDIATRGKLSDIQGTGMLKIVSKSILLIPKLSKIHCTKLAEFYI